MFISFCLFFYYFFFVTLLDSQKLPLFKFKFQIFNMWTGDIDSNYCIRVMVLIYNFEFGQKKKITDEKKN